MPPQARSEGSSCRPGGCRCRPGRREVVNDAYNANPASVGAALDALAAMAAGRRIAVLGLMAELDDPGPARPEVAARAEALGSS